MRRWPWFIAAAVTVVNITAGVLWSDGTPLRSPWMLPVATLMLVGAMLTSRVPGTPIGPLCLTFGLAAGTTAILPYSLPFTSDLQAAWASAIGASLNTIVVVATLIPLVLRFPDGKLLSDRWRRAQWAAAVTAIVGGVAALMTGGWGGAVDQAVVESPLYDFLGGVAGAIEPVFYTILSGLFGLAAVSVVVRFRNAEEDAREQLRWLMSAAVVMALAVVAASASGVSTDVEALIIAAAMSLFPVAIAIAVLRYRLYDLNLVISRTLLFGMLVAFITGVYTLIVVGVGATVGGNENLILSIGSTALVAVLFEPVRTRAQRWANHLVFGRRATPYEVLGDLTNRLAATESHEGLLERIAARLADGTGARRAGVWIIDGGGYRALAAHPPLPPADSYRTELPGVVVPIEQAGAVVGLLSVETHRGETLTPTELRLTEDLAGSAGLVLTKASLDAELAAKAADLAESRRRLVGAEDAERRRIEQTLEGGVQQQIVALKLQLGIAARTAEEEDGGQTVELLRTMTDEAQEAIDQIRTLALGIYPPLLESEGLRGALLAVVDQAPVGTQTRIERVGKLPKEIEGAVYFTVLEAFTNAIKHGKAPICVELNRNGDAIEFTVTDTGPGFDVPRAVHGSGLANLADRIETVGGDLRVESIPGSPTTVRGIVPIRESSSRVPDLAAR